MEQELIDDIKLGTDQKAVFELIENKSESVFVTGGAGTGKSLLLKYFVNNTTKRCIVVAPTGVAALNAGGQTIHSLFKLSFEIQEMKDIYVGTELKYLLNNIDTLIIDEVSMVCVDIMEIINKKLQIARENNEPFGGVQLVLFGDLFQLPPVISDKDGYRYLDDTYGSVFFFSAPSIKKMQLKVIELKENFRQNDKSFVSILNCIRKGDRISSSLIELNKRTCEKLPSEETIILSGRNETVTKINHDRLLKIDSEEFIYEASVVGDFKESAFPTEKFLKLKVGAQVMMMKNDTTGKKRWVNGTIGTIEALSENLIEVKINGVIHAVDKAMWENHQYHYDADIKELSKDVIGVYKQFPLRLAWAITIHKSQGQTFSSVIIDLRQGAFSSGQTYVALSRCRTLEKTYLLSPIKYSDILVSNKIIEYMKNIDCVFN